MTKTEVLDFINNGIVDENGVKVTLDSDLFDAGLDSLGTLMLMAGLDSEYGIYDPDLHGEDFFTSDLKNLTVRDLVTKCIVAARNL